MTPKLDSIKKKINQILNSNFDALYGAQIDTIHPDINIRKQSLGKTAIALEKIIEISNFYISVINPFKISISIKF